MDNKTISYKDVLDQHEASYSKLVEKVGMFFAFSKERLHEQLAERSLTENDVEHRGPLGGFIPVKNIDAYNDGVISITNTYVMNLKRLDGEERDKAIFDELESSNAWIKGDIREVVEYFQDIFTEKEVASVYNKEAGCVWKNGSWQKQDILQDK